MTVAAVQTDSAASAAAATGAQSVKDLGERFLTLLVTQLKNQDPMNPMENAELTTQLAQMSTVEGVGNLNDTLTEMARSSQLLQGAALIGRSVLAEGDSLELAGSGAAGGVGLDAKADSVTVTVLDADGRALRVLDLGKQEAGLARFAWDGRDTAGNRVADGEYTFKVAASAAGRQVTATAHGLDRVLSVAMNGGGMDVELARQGTRGLDAIKQVF